MGAEILKITKQNGPTKKEMQVISFTPVKKLKKMSLFVSNLIPQSDVKQKCGGLHITLSVIHLRVGLSFFPPFSFLMWLRECHTNQEFLHPASASLDNPSDI